MTASIFRKQAHNHATKIGQPAVQLLCICPLSHSSSQHYSHHTAYLLLQPANPSAVSKPFCSALARAHSARQTRGMHLQCNHDQKQANACQQACLPVHIRTSSRACSRHTASDLGQSQLQHISTTTFKSHHYNCCHPSSKQPVASSSACNLDHLNNMHLLFCYEHR